MCWNKKAVSRSQWQKIRSRLINWAENLDRSWLEQDNLLPTRLLILLLWQPRLHGSLPMDRRLWHPEQEHFDSATGLEWVRQGVLVLYSQLPRKFQINIKRKVGVGSNAGSWEKQNRHVEEPRWSAGQLLNLAETETCASCPCQSKSEIRRPKSSKKAQADSLIGPRVSTAVGWLQVHIFGLLTRCCQLCCGAWTLHCQINIRVSHWTDDCHIPGQRPATFKRHYCKTIRSLAILMACYYYYYYY